MTDFSTALHVVPVGNLTWSAELDASWGQGRTTFGGLVAALAARVAGEVAGADRPLRTLDVAFVAPLPPGPCIVDVEVLGSGRSVTQLLVSIRSGGVLGARAHVVAGAARASGIRVAPPPASSAVASSAGSSAASSAAGPFAAGPFAGGGGDPAEQGVPLQYQPGVTPVLTQNIEYRWCSPALPFSAAGPGEAYINGWARHRTPAPGVEAMIALLDAWPPAVLVMADHPVPASTVRWAIHLPPAIREAPGGAYDGDKQWVWYESRTVAADEGYVTMQATIHAEGRLLAWSEQLVTIYDQR